MHTHGPTRLQQLALQFAEKTGQFLETNERLVDLRFGRDPAAAAAASASSGRYYGDNANYQRSYYRGGARGATSYRGASYRGPDGANRRAARQNVVWGQQVPAALQAGDGAEADEQ